MELRGGSDGRVEMLREGAAVFELHLSRQFVCRHPKLDLDLKSYVACIVFSKCVVYPVKLHS